MRIIDEEQQAEMEQRVVDDVAAFWRRIVIVVGGIVAMLVIAASAWCGDESLRDEAPHVVMSVVSREAAGVESVVVTVQARLRGEPKASGGWLCLSRQWSIWARDAASQSGYGLVRQYPVEGTPAGSPCASTFEERSWQHSFSLPLGMRDGQVEVRVDVFDRRGKKIAGQHMTPLT